MDSEEQRHIRRLVARIPRAALSQEEVECQVDGWSFRVDAEGGVLFNMEEKGLSIFAAFDVVELYAFEHESDSFKTTGSEVIFAAEGATEQLVVWLEPKPDKGRWGCHLQVTGAVKVLVRLPRSVAEALLKKLAPLASG
jgi:hypothetical protein